MNKPSPEENLRAKSSPKEAARIGRIVIPASIKRYYLDQDKLVPPQETINRLMPKLKRFKIINSFERLDTLYDKLDIPVVFCHGGENFKKISPDKGQWGKGITVGQSKASAMMECWERFVWQYFFRKELPLEKNISLNEIEKKHESAVNNLLIASISLPDSRKERKDIESALKKLAMPHTQLFKFNSPRQITYPYLWYIWANTTNGLSTGNNLTESLLQGICEVMERDSIASFFTKDTSEDIDIYSIKDRYCKELMNKFWQSKIKLYIKDISQDYPFPTILVVAEDTVPLSPETEITMAAGTSSSKEKALIRALTEIAQIRTQSLQQSDQAGRGIGALSGFPNRGEDKKKILERIKNNRGEKADFNSVRSDRHADMKKELVTVLNDLENKNYRLYCKIFDPPPYAANSIKNPVIHWIIPRARHLDYRTAEGKKSIYFYIAKMLQSEKKDEEALHYLDKAQKYDGSMPYILFAKALCLLNLDKTGKAQRAFLQCKEESEKRGAYIYQGEAGKYLQELSKVNPEN